MAENESKSGFNLPWANVVALLAAAGGIFTLIPTLDTSRPPDPGGESMSVFGDQTVDSRLWQDPFEEVLKDKKKPDPNGPKHTSKELTEAIADERKREDNTVWAMIVMVNSGPHAEPRERRLRTRTAVVHGLWSSGFAPRDSAHIGYIKTHWPRSSHELFGKTESSSGVVGPPPGPVKKMTRPEETKRPMDEAADLPEIGEGGEAETETLPFEWFEAVGKRQSVIVVYLQEDACRDRPFARLAWLSRELGLGPEKPDSKRLVRTTVLGPMTSTVLDGMVRELPLFDKRSDADIRQQLRKVEIFSPTATASDGALLPEFAQWANENKKDWAMKVAHAHQEKMAEGDIQKFFPEPYEAKVKDWVRERIQATFRDEELVFQRTIPTDAENISETIVELQRRGVNPTRWIEDPRYPGSLIDGQGKANYRNSVAIISELDTTYGRALPVAFVEQCDYADFTELGTEGMARTAPWIRRYHYLRGLDGRLPGDEKEKKTGDASSKEEQKQTPGARPDGHDQTDSLLRLAASLASDDRKERNEGKRGFRAIGILGSDVYDKLLILRALRPMFPGVVFFSNNLDAQLSQPEEWKAAHNLVVVSGFGLRLHDRWQKNVPPFRDGYQTATFLATLVATGVVAHDPVPGPVGTPIPTPSDFALSRIMDIPRVFEIGRHGALDLTVNTLGGFETARDGAWTFKNAQVSENFVRIHPLRTDLKQWWSRGVLHATVLGAWEVPVSLALGTAFALAFAIIFYRAAVAVRPLASGGETARAKPRLLLWMERSYPLGRPGARQLHGICGMNIREPWQLLHKWITLSTLIMGMAGAVIAVAVVSFAYRTQWIKGEPFAWFEGVSVWPGVAIRIFGIVLAIHFVLKSYCLVLESDSEIGERFALGSDRNECKDAKVKGRGWLYSFAPWTVRFRTDERPEELAPTILFREKSFDACELWCQYIWRGWWWYRLVRVAVLTLLFLSFAWCLFAAFDSGFPASPTRSYLSNRFDHGSDFLLLGLAAFLTLFVVDALWLNASFIRLFSQGFTRWPRVVVENSGRLGLLRESEIADELDIQLIATRTKAIGEFVLYPFVIVALLVVSRAPYFDNWGWTNGLILILGALLALTVIAALALRDAAETTRKGALSRLRAARSVELAKDDPESGKKIQVLDDMISRIAEVDEGAFAPFSQQPIIRALLFPAGGVGMWELARQVLGKF